MKYFKYENYRNVKSQKIKDMIKQDARQAKLHQSISKKMPSSSRFSTYENKKANFKKTIKNKLSSMILAMVNKF